MIPDFPNFWRMHMAVHREDTGAGWWLGSADVHTERGDYWRAASCLTIAVAPYFAATWDWS